MVYDIGTSLKSGQQNISVFKFDQLNLVLPLQGFDLVSYFASPNIKYYFN